MRWQGPAEAWHDSTKARISLVSTGSLGGWDFRRFRSNLLVDGDGEDALIGSRIRVGGATATVMNGIDRCIISPLNHKGSRATNEQERVQMLANFAKSSLAFRRAAAHVAPTGGAIA